MLSRKKILRKIFLQTICCVVLLFYKLRCFFEFNLVIFHRTVLRGTYWGRITAAVIVIALKCPSHYDFWNLFELHFPKSELKWYWLTAVIFLTLTLVLIIWSWFTIKKLSFLYFTFQCPVWGFFKQTVTETIQTGQSLQCTNKATCHNEKKEKSLERKKIIFCYN